MNDMINVEEITELKSHHKKFLIFIKNNFNNIRVLIKVLNKLGTLPEDFDPKPLLILIKHKNQKIRYLTVKNLAKLKRFDLLDIYI